jgi:energy-coupling factor transporter ATP-binding protein EcfA2
MRALAERGVVWCSPPTGCGGHGDLRRGDHLPQRENVGSIDFAHEGKDPQKIIAYITGEAQQSAGAAVAAGAGEVVFRSGSLAWAVASRTSPSSCGGGRSWASAAWPGKRQHERCHSGGGYPGLECTAEVAGRRVRLKRPVQAIRNKVLFVPGDRQLEGLFLNHSLFTNIVFPKLGLRRQPLFTPRRKYRRECAQAIEVLSIKAHSLDMPVSALSGGNQQKVVSGQVSLQANVLLLADPAKGVDVGPSGPVRIHPEAGAGEPAERDPVCQRQRGADRLLRSPLIMYEGQIVASLEGGEITDDAIVSTSMRCAEVNP